jgi:GT2 family glycosyltransferase
MGRSVYLTISSFRNDEAVAALLESAASLVPRVFTHVIVVDSLGTGRVEQLIRDRGWPWVTYESASVNLGSAGNLALRLQLAAACGADFAYALNHDGRLSEKTVTAMVDAADAIEHIGAAYPLRILANRSRRYDVTGASSILIPRRTRLSPPEDSVLEAYWGSSNGALYALRPVREGLAPWSDLWMGWEDLGYGWLLHSRGYRQVIVRDAVFEDPYEFRAVSDERGFYVSDKPSWYAYYAARNLILIGRRLKPGLHRTASLGCRIALECGTTALLRPQKRERLRLIARGVFDGLRGRAGKLA